jgi:hypothetical protein
MPVPHNWDQDEQSLVTALAAALESDTIESSRVLMRLLDVVPRLDARRSLPILLAALKRHESPHAQLAAEIIGQFGGRAIALVPDLSQILTDRTGGYSTSTIRAALYALKGIGVYSRRAKYGILETAFHKNHTIRSVAMDVLGELGNEDSDSLAAIKAGICDSDIDVRIAAAFASWKISGDSRFVRQILNEETEWQRSLNGLRLRYVVERACHLSRERRGYEVLALLMAYRDEAVKVNAALALYELSGSSALAAEVLERCLDSMEEENWKLQIHVAVVLSTTTKYQVRAVDLFKTRLTSKLTDVRAVATALLPRLAITDEERAAYLVSALQDRDVIVRQVAVAVSGDLRCRNSRVLDLLRSMTQHEPDQIIKWLSSDSLSKLEQAKKSSRPDRK